MMACHQSWAAVPDDAGLEGSGIPVLRALLRTVAGRWTLITLLFHHAIFQFACLLVYPRVQVIESFKPTTTHQNIHHARTMQPAS